MAKKSSKSSKKKSDEMVDPEEDLEEEVDVVEAEEVDEEEEDEDEEDEDEEDEDEEEEEKPKVSKTKQRSRAKKRRMRARRKRNRIVAGVIALILISAILFTWFYSPPPSGVDIVFNADDEFNPGDGLDILIDTQGGGMNGYSGPFTIKTSVNGTETYSEEFTMKNGYSTIQLEYSKFLTQNGEYTIEADVAGVKGTTEYTLRNVVEDIGSFVGRDYKWYRSNQLVEGGKTNITLTLTLIRYTSAGQNTTVIAQPGHTIDIEVIPPSGSSQSKALDIGSKAQNQLIYKADNRGEYSFKCVYKNTHIRTDSPYWTITRDISVSVNAPPLAEAGPNQDVIIINPLAGVTVKFDASTSMDDGSILEYEWNFGVWTDPVNDTRYGEDIVTSSQPTAEWTYYEIDDYTVTLKVKDNGLPGVSESEKYGGDYLFVRVR